MLSVHLVSLRAQLTSINVPKRRTCIAVIPRRRLGQVFGGDKNVPERKTTENEEPKVVDLTNPVVEKMRALYQLMIRKPGQLLQGASINPIKPKTLTGGINSELCHQINKETFLDIYSLQAEAAKKSSVEDNRTVPGLLKDLSLAPNVDFLKLAITRATTKDQIFRVIMQHGQVMDKDHLLLCLIKFTDLLSRGESVEELRSSEPFQELFKITCSRINLFDASECVTIVELSIKFKLGADSPLIQGVSEALRLKVKDFELVDLMRLFSKLDKIKGTSMHLEAIKLAIPVIFQTRLHSGLDTTNIHSCFRALIFTFVAKMDVKTTEFVAKAALEFAPRFSLQMALIISRRAAYHPMLLHEIAPLRNIVQICVDTINNNWTKLDERAIQGLVYDCLRHQVGSKRLFDVLWNLAPSWSINQIGNLLRASFRVNYMTFSAAEVATNLILDRRNEISATDPKLFTVLAEAVALHALHHDSDDSDEVVRCSEAAKILADAEGCVAQLSDKSLSFVKFLLCLSVTGVRPTKYLDLVFSDEFQNKILTERVNLRPLHELEQCLLVSSTESSPYKMLPDLKRAAINDTDRDFVHVPLLKTLEAALGGSQFLCKNVKTPLGTVADFAVALRKGEFAIALQDSTTMFENLPPESKVVAVLVAKDKRDLFSLTGLKKLSLMLRERYIRLQKICPLVICSAELKSLEAKDRTLFVMTGLKNALLEGPEYHFRTTSKDERRSV